MGFAIPGSIQRPRSRAAWWSIGFGLGFFVLLAFGMLGGAEVSWGSLHMRPALAFVLGIGALASGLAAWRAGERSVLLWVGLVPGALSVLLLVAELFFIE